MSTVISRREALRRGTLGVAGLVAAGGLSPHVFAAATAKTPEQKAAEEKAARDTAANAGAMGRAEAMEGAGAPFTLFKTAGLGVRSTIP